VLASISYVISLARWNDPRELSKRAKRVLRFFAALNRSSEIGYQGTRAALAAVAEAVARATEEACSVSTLERALRELVEAGYLLKAYGFTDNVREIAPKEFIRDRVVVLTLTAKALAIWSCPTPDHKPSICRNDDRPFGASEVPSCLEGNHARAIEDAPPDRDVASSGDNEEPLRGVAGHRAGSAVAVAVTEPRQSPRPVAPLAELADGDRLEEASQAVCQRSRTVAPRRAPRPSGEAPRARREVVAELLETLAAVTYGRGRLERAVKARAALEMYAGDAALEPSGVDWGYWLAQWPKLTRAERRRWARLEIVPLLAAAPAPPATETRHLYREPSSPERRSAEGEPRSPSGGEPRSPANVQNASNGAASRSGGGVLSSPERGAGGGVLSSPKRGAGGREATSPELAGEIAPDNPYADTFRRLFPNG